MTNPSESRAVGDGANTDKAPDPFDLDALRLSQSFTETAGVKKLLMTVLVDKPHNQDWVRVHPGQDYRADFFMIELKHERERYLVHPSVAPELIGEFRCVTLFTAINRQGVVFLWPVRLPTAGDKPLEWWRSAREGAELAMSRWVRVMANTSLGAYQMFVAESVMSEPDWPEASYQKLIELAFRDRLITTIDHPVVKRLRGLV
jgi:hypothetical protein